MGIVPIITININIVIIIIIPIIKASMSGTMTRKSCVSSPARTCPLAKRSEFDLAELVQP